MWVLGREQQYAVGASCPLSPLGCSPLPNCTLHLPGSWEMLRDPWEGRPLDCVWSPCPPSLPNSLTLPHCHCLPHGGLFHPNGDGKDPPAPSWSSPLSCPSARQGPRSVRWGPWHRSQDGMSPCAEDTGRAARTAGCDCQMFLFLSSQTPRCKLSNTISAAGSPRDSWVTKMCRVRQGSAGHQVPTVSHRTWYGQVLALLCTMQTSWRATQCLGMVAHTGLAGQLQWGI